MIESSACGGMVTVCNSWNWRGGGGTVLHSYQYQVCDFSNSKFETKRTAPCFGRDCKIKKEEES